MGEARISSFAASAFAECAFVVGTQQNTPGVSGRHHPQGWAAGVNLAKEEAISPKTYYLTSPREYVAQLVAGDAFEEAV